MGGCPRWNQGQVNVGLDLETRLGEELERFRAHLRQVREQERRDPAIPRRRRRDAFVHHRSPPVTAGLRRAEWREGLSPEAAAQVDAENDEILRRAREAFRPGERNRHPTRQRPLPLSSSPVLSPDARRSRGGEDSQARDDHLLAQDLQAQIWDEEEDDAADRFAASEASSEHASHGHRQRSPVPRRSGNRRRLPPSPHGRRGRDPTRRVEVQHGRRSYTPPPTQHTAMFPDGASSRGQHGMVDACSSSRNRGCPAPLRRSADLRQRTTAPHNRQRRGRTRTRSMSLTAAGSSRSSRRANSTPDRRRRWSLESAAITSSSSTSSDSSAPVRRRAARRPLTLRRVIADTLHGLADLFSNSR